MRMRNQSIVLLGSLMGTIALSQSVAQAGDFIDTRISYTIGDDDFLKNAGEKNPNSPMLSIGDRPGYGFNVNSATSGRENQLNLVLYKKMTGFVPRLTTEAAATIKLDFAELQQDDARINKILRDNSSYIRLSYALDRDWSTDKKSGNFLETVLFPLSSDRFRVGYLYALSWGGTDMFPRKQGNLGPAFKIGGTHGRVYWWGGMKFVPSTTAPKESKDEQGLTISTEELETFYGALGGAGVTLFTNLNVDFGAAYIQMGENPIRDVSGKLVTATGFSGRVSYGRGMKASLSSDLQLQRNDPEYLESLSKKPTYKPGEGVMWRLTAEGTAIAQSLADRNRFGQTTSQLATAAALYGQVQINYWRFGVLGMYRSLQFLLLKTPSFVPFEAFPSDAEVSPDLWGSLTVDYHIPRWALTPGLELSVQLPATLKTVLTATEVGSNAPATVIGENSIVFRQLGGNDPRSLPEILPQDKDRLPLYHARLTTNWYASDMLTMVAFAFITYDSNAVTMRVNPDLSKTRLYDDAVGFGAGITAQARF